ncbi:winged helix-turn-helix transcriptional regulator [Sphingomonas sp. AP4-R1]|uniref:MarR family winged helix-turn-helix transcriptional regulator n=1 Tax=Sphingomonas sp. AP4-R1 TaxID=2735134 RepID=UPI0014938F4E|nr:helix-turn-helix domain-containing protein [Sphingomonas sp. AP4-R1]QJU60482.1 winged helix-turn-helix transcriptional regulator [Sphingomonas sp. AP4-R1]
MPLDEPGFLPQEDYEALAAFRYELRRFLQFSEQAAKQQGLTPQQHQALLAMRADSRGGMTIGELGEQLFIQPHSASELTDRLIALDLVAREPEVEDRRRIWLRLTPEATRRLGRLSMVHRDEVVRIRPVLSAILGRLG